MRKSGPFERWSRQVEADLQSLESLNEAFEELNADHSMAGTTELEKMIVGAHALKATFEALHQKYSSALADDDAKRANIREDARFRGARE